MNLDSNSLRIGSPIGPQEEPPGPPENDTVTTGKPNPLFPELQESRPVSLSPEQRVLSERRRSLPEPPEPNTWTASQVQQDPDARRARYRGFIGTLRQIRDALFGSDVRVGGDHDAGVARGSWLGRQLMWLRTRKRTVIRTPDDFSASIRRAHVRRANLAQSGQVYARADGVLNLRAGPPPETVVGKNDYHLLRDLGVSLKDGNGQGGQFFLAQPTSLEQMEHYAGFGATFQKIRTGDPRELKLFPFGPPSLSDLRKPERLPTSPLLSTLATILANPHRDGAGEIEKNMVDHGDGSVTVRFSDMDVRVEKDRVLDESGKDVFNGRSTWVRVMEKAYIARLSQLNQLENPPADAPQKALGHLIAGMTPQEFAAVESAGPQPLDLNDANFFETAKRLAEQSHGTASITLRTNDRVFGTRLHPNHSYAVLTTCEAKRGNQTVQGYLIFDPYGTGVGGTADLHQYRDYRVNDQGKRVIDYKNLSRGQTPFFFMTHEEVQRNFLGGATVYDPVDSTASSRRIREAKQLLDNRPSWRVVREQVRDRTAAIDPKFFADLDEPTMESVAKAMQHGRGGVIASLRTHYEKVIKPQYGDEAPRRDDWVEGVLLRFEEGMSDGDREFYFETSYLRAYREGGQLGFVGAEFPDTSGRALRRLREAYDDHAREVTARLDDDGLQQGVHDRARFVLPPREAWVGQQFVDLVSEMPTRPRQTLLRHASVGRLRILHDALNERFATGQQKPGDDRLRMEVVEAIRYHYQTEVDRKIIDPDKAGPVATARLSHGSEVSRAYGDLTERQKAFVQNRRLYDDLTLLDAPLRQQVLDTLEDSLVGSGDFFPQFYHDLEARPPGNLPLTDAYLRQPHAPNDPVRRRVTEISQSTIEDLATGRNDALRLIPGPQETEKLSLFQCFEKGPEEVPGVFERMLAAGEARARFQAASEAFGIPSRTRETAELRDAMASMLRKLEEADFKDPNLTGASPEDFQNLARLRLLAREHRNLDGGALLERLDPILNARQQLIRNQFDLGPLLTGLAQPGNGREHLIEALYLSHHQSEELIEMYHFLEQGRPPEPNDLPEMQRAWILEEVQKLNRQEVLELNQALGSEAAGRLEAGMLSALEKVPFDRQPLFVHLQSPLTAFSQIRHVVEERAMALDPNLQRRPPSRTEPDPRPLEEQFSERELEALRTCAWRGVLAEARARPLPEGLRIGADGRVTGTTPFRYHYRSGQPVPFREAISQTFGLEKKAMVEPDSRIWDLGRGVYQRYFSDCYRMPIEFHLRDGKVIDTEKKAGDDRTDEVARQDATQALTDFTEDKGAALLLSRVLNQELPAFLQNAVSLPGLEDGVLLQQPPSRSDRGEPIHYTIRRQDGTEEQDVRFRAYRASRITVTRTEDGDYRIHVEWPSEFIGFTAPKLGFRDQLPLGPEQALRVTYRLDLVVDAKAATDRRLVFKQVGPGGVTYDGLLPPQRDRLPF